MGRVNVDDVVCYCEGNHLPCFFCPWASGMDPEDEILIESGDGFLAACDGCGESIPEPRDLVDAFCPQPRRAFTNLN